MIQPAIVNPCAASTPNRLSPPRARAPKLVQGVGFAFLRRTAMRNWIKRHGRIFEINVPLFGRSIVVSDPALVRSVCTASAEQLANVRPNLGNWFGPGSVFGLDGSRHRDRRRLLAPAFHGQRLKNYEKAIEHETLRESANWPEDKEFRTLEPMNRITLNVILRTIFGAEGTELNELREITLIGAGHETIASALSWTFERLRDPALPDTRRPADNDPGNVLSRDSRPNKAHLLRATGQRPRQAHLTSLRATVPARATTQQRR